MPPVTFEGVVENGQIRLSDSISLPEKAKVYVVIPDMEAAGPFHVLSPRLVHPEDADRFTMEVSEVQDNASL